MVRLAHAAAGTAVILAATGCGGGNGDHSTAAATGRASYIKQADAICEEADQKQTAGLNAYVERHNAQEPGKTGQVKLADTYGLPPIRIEIRKIRRLEPPGGDESEIDAIIKGLTQAIGSAEENPASLLESPGPFAGVEKLAREFGFNACATPG